MSASAGNPGPPAPAVDLHQPQDVIDLLARARQANLQAPARHGNCIHLPSRGRLMMSGDLHDHTINFQRLVKIAQLDQSPDHHLVLHELTHGKHTVNGRDLSIRLLARVAELKARYPHQVHLLLANHDLAQALDYQILKDGRSVTQAFRDGVEFLYHDRAPEVHQAAADFILSFPLAVRSETGLLCAHSLPAPHTLPRFDPTILDRPLTPPDFAHGGPVYQMIWGRQHTPELAQALADAWKARFFILGHQPADMGYYEETDRILILASDHEHGVALPLELDRRYRELSELVDSLILLAGVRL